MEKEIQELKPLTKEQKKWVNILQVELDILKLQVDDYLLEEGIKISASLKLISDDIEIRRYVRLEYNVEYKSFYFHRHEEFEIESQFKDIDKKGYLEAIVTWAKEIYKDFFPEVNYVLLSNAIALSELKDKINLIISNFEYAFKDEGKKPQIKTELMRRPGQVPKSLFSKFKKLYKKVNEKDITMGEMYELFYKGI